MRTLLVIPARYASARYPGKPLAQLRGATGVSRSLVERSHEAALSVRGVERVVVATDDARIADHVRGFGGEVVMTPASCRNGTERCAAALAALGGGFDLVVNLQGDAPLTPHWFVEALIEAAEAEPAAEVLTPVLRCEAQALENFVEDRRHGRVGATTAVFDRAGRALYFSKEVLPYRSRALTADETIPVFHHVGVYAYRPDALMRYAALPEGILERWEGLEQLRFMEEGIAVHCVEVAARGRPFWELNNLEDVRRLEAALEELGIA